MSLTIQQRLQVALEARGYEIDHGHPTRKYLVMRPTLKYTGQMTMTHRYFLGSAGALRFSSTGNVTGCVATPKTKARLLHLPVPA